MPPSLCPNMVSFELTAKVILPWPDSRLNPNFKRSNSHWVYGPVAQKAKDDAWAMGCAQLPQDVRKRIADGPERIVMTISFYPPDKRWRDDDNMVGSFKHHRDGLALALGVDDRRFRPHYFFEDPCKPGRVEVEFCTGNQHANAGQVREFVLKTSGPTKRDNASPGLTDNRLVRGGAHGSSAE